MVSITQTVTVSGTPEITLSFDTRADALLAQTGDSKFIQIGELKYAYDASGTALTTGDGRKWKPMGTVTVKHFGAIGDGITDDTSAVKSAFLSSDNIHFPKGTYLITGKNITPSSTATECHVTGDGMGVSHIKWTGDDGVNEAGTGSKDLFNFLGFTNRADTVSFRDITISGSHDSNRSNVGSYPLIVQKADYVRFENVEVFHSRTMSIAVRGAVYASATNCYVHHGARDGINFANCERTSITENRCEFLDDDAIAVHNQVYTDCRGHVVKGNNVFMSQGIVALGVQSATISNNVIQYYFGRGINVTNVAAAAGALEGVSATTGVSITGNVLMDPIDRGGLDALNDMCFSIMISGDSAESGSEPFVPGTHNVVPYGYYANASNTNDTGAVGLPIPASGNISVTGNIVKRTMPLTGMFSTLGLGLFWLRDGEYDYDMSTSSTNSSAFRFMSVGGKQVDGVLVADNISSGINVGMSFDTATNIRNFVVARNQFLDTIVRCVQFSPAVSGSKFNISFVDNVFDGDPYHRHEDRQALGRWSAVDDLTCFLVQGAEGLVFQRNVFKNFSRITDFGISSKAQDGRIKWEGNDIYGDPNADQFSTTNGGVGEIQNDAPDLGFVHIECDPTSADFGKIYRVSRVSRSGITPISSGKYVTGEVVEVNSKTVLGSSPNRYLLRGFMRLTTGTSHVAGTDWVEIRAPVE